MSKKQSQKNAVLEQGIPNDEGKSTRHSNFRTDQGIEFDSLLIDAFSTDS